MQHPVHSSPPLLVMYRTLSLLLFSLLVTVGVTHVQSNSSSAIVVSFSSDQCTSPTLTSLTSPTAHNTLTWSSKDGDGYAASVIDYNLCGQRSQDLMYITHLTLVYWENDQPLMERTFGICDDSAKRQACLDQLSVSSHACLTGSVVVRTPAFANSPDGRTRSEIRVSEGLGSVTATFCSL